MVLGLGSVIPLGTLCVLRLDFTDVRLEVSRILETSERSDKRESKRVASKRQRRGNAGIV